MTEFEQPQSEAEAKLRRRQREWAARAAIAAEVKKTGRDVCWLILCVVGTTGWVVLDVAGVLGAL